MAIMKTTKKYKNVRKTRKIRHIRKVHNRTKVLRGGSGKKVKPQELQAENLPLFFFSKPVRITKLQGPKQSLVGKGSAHKTTYPVVPDGFAQSVPLSQLRNSNPQSREPMKPFQPQFSYNPFTDPLVTKAVPVNKGNGKGKANIPHTSLFRKNIQNEKKLAAAREYFRSKTLPDNIKTQLQIMKDYNKVVILLSNIPQNSNKNLSMFNADFLDYIKNNPFVIQSILEAPKSSGVIDTRTLPKENGNKGNGNKGNGNKVVVNTMFIPIIKRQFQLHKRHNAALTSNKGSIYGNLEPPSPLYTTWHKNLNLWGEKNVAAHTRKNNARNNARQYIKAYYSNDAQDEILIQAVKIFRNSDKNDREKVENLKVYLDKIKVNKKNIQNVAEYLHELYKDSPTKTLTEQTNQYTLSNFQRQTTQNKAQPNKVKDNVGINSTHSNTKIPLFIFYQNYNPHPKTNHTTYTLLKDENNKNSIEYFQDLYANPLLNDNERKKLLHQHLVENNYNPYDKNLDTVITQLNTYFKNNKSAK